MDDPSRPPVAFILPLDHATVAAAGPLAAAAVDPSNEGVALLRTEAGLTAPSFDRCVGLNQLPLCAATASDDPALLSLHSTLSDSPLPLPLPLPLQRQPPLEKILASTKVLTKVNGVAFDYSGTSTVEEVRRCIECLDVLIEELSSLVHNNPALSKIATSPGFDTVDSTAVWRDAGILPYETLDGSAANSYYDGAVGGAVVGGGEMPIVPSVEVAVGYFRLMRDVWAERYEYVVSASVAANAEVKGERVAGGGGGDGADPSTAFCSCITKWLHCGPKRNVLAWLVNQVLEQLMSMEASACLRQHGSEICHLWNREGYAPEKCPHPSSMEGLCVDSKVRLFRGRDEYLRTYVAAALEAESTIDIMVCYLFHGDPASRYILLDLLPHAAMRGVRVRLLFESMILESQFLQSAFNAGPAAVGGDSQAADKFMNHLPEGSPPFVNAAKTFAGAANLVREFLDSVASLPNVHVRYWMARDKLMRYRVKNHSKCHIFDGGRVIAGGSNVVPRADNLDTDFVIEGRAAGMYLMDFENVWNAMSVETAVTDAVFDEKKEDASPLSQQQLYRDVDDRAESPSRTAPTATGHESRIFFLASQPSSMGEDIILRSVLGGINAATKTVHIISGHCNTPLPVTHALKAATERGVRVQVVTNSLYSCDLRCGQRDLFLSLQQMLTIAPDVELFVTTMKDGKRPPFLHSKYVVVDSTYSWTGSWNMWTRSAFYEKEAEVFVQSETFAIDLIEKFEEERDAYSVRVASPSDCENFLPTGCFLCKGFGPFYDA